MKITFRNTSCIILIRFLTFCHEDCESNNAAGAEKISHSYFHEYGVMPPGFMNVFIDTLTRKKTEKTPMNIGKYYHKGKNWAQ